MRQIKRNQQVQNQINSNLNQNSQILIQSQNDNQIESQPNLSPAKLSNISVITIKSVKYFNDCKCIKIIPNNECTKSKINENDVYLLYTEHIYTDTILKLQIRS